MFLLESFLLKATFVSPHQRCLILLRKAFITLQWPFRISFIIVGGALHVTFSQIKFNENRYRFWGRAIFPKLKTISPAGGRHEQFAGKKRSGEIECERKCSISILTKLNSGIIALSCFVVLKSRTDMKLNIFELVFLVLKPPRFLLQIRDLSKWNLLEEIK